MKKVGLYFGTFNPIHIGHLAIANHMVEFSELDEVWFVITPQSPFKHKEIPAQRPPSLPNGFGGDARISKAKAQ